MSSGTDPGLAAQAWIDNHAGAFDLSPTDLQLTGSNLVGVGTTTVFRYQAYIGGNPVEFSRVRLLVLNAPGPALDRVIYVAATGLTPPLAAGHGPEQIDEATVLSIVQNLPAYQHLTDWSSLGKVIYYYAGSGSPPVRTWKIAGSDISIAEAYTFFVEDITGNVVHIRNDVHEAGQVTGTVKARITPGTLPDCPDPELLPPECTLNPPVPVAEAVPMPDLRVQLDTSDPLTCDDPFVDVGCDGDWTVTGSDGTYTVDFRGTAGPVRVLADLRPPFDWPCVPPVTAGPWVNVINCGGVGFDCVPQDPLVACAADVTPDDPPNVPVLDLVVNEVPDHNGFSTAQANCFYHATLAHNFYKELQPDSDITEILHPTNCWVNKGTFSSVFDNHCVARTTVHGESRNIFFGEAGYPSPGFGCRNMAFSTVIAHEYAHTIFILLGFDDLTTLTAHEGFADALALLLYDDPIIARDMCVSGGLIHSGRDYTNACPPVEYPCEVAPASCGIEGCLASDLHHGCGKLLAGVWWDIRQNVGLVATQQLFTDWSQFTIGGEPAITAENHNSAHPLTAIEVLTANDDDGEINNGTPDDDLICDGFQKHAIECPELCADGIDTDRDGCSDADDADCGGTETLCDDDLDNDCDGLEDCDDPDCCVDPVCPPEPPCCQSYVECDDAQFCTCDACDSATKTCTFTSTIYGDIICNGLSDIDDLICVLTGFADFAVCPDGDIFPCEGNAVIDIDDVVAMLAAFAGLPAPCCSGTGGLLGGSGFGPLAPWPPILVDPIISLVVNPSTIGPGECSTVEAFISGGSNLQAYQVALSVTGGTLGTLDLDTLSIDIVRQDYVFSGLSSVTPLDQSGVRLGGALYSGGINPGSSKYLGTFTFRASNDAGGTFTVDFRTAETFLRDSNRDPITWDSGGSVNISVQAP